MLRIFTAYRGRSRVWFTRFEQRWNEDESSSVHRETVAFTMRVKPVLLEKQQRQQRLQQQSHVNTSENKVQLQKRKKILREDRIWTMIPGWHAWRRYFSRLSSSSMFTSTPWQTSQRRSESNVLGYYTSSIVNGEAYKIPKFTCKDWSHCLYRRSFKALNWAIFVQSEDHKRIIPPRMMNYAKIPWKSTIHQ